MKAAIFIACILALSVITIACSSEPQVQQNPTGDAAANLENNFDEGYDEGADSTSADDIDPNAFDMQ
jgi:hypothetical protein